MQMNRALAAIVFSQSLTPLHKHALRGDRTSERQNVTLLVLGAIFQYNKTGLFQGLIRQRVASVQPLTHQCRIDHKRVMIFECNFRRFWQPEIFSADMRIAECISFLLHFLFCMYLTPTLLEKQICLQKFQKILLPPPQT